MLIIPAIDLKDGVCVRLMQGRFDEVTDYGDPFARLREFAGVGAEWVHIVDLDGARLGRPAQYDLIAKLAQDTGLKIQCGGGVRSRAHVETLLETGVARVVVGSVAVRDPKNVRDWLVEFGPESICAAFDVRASGDDWEVVAHGWTEGAGTNLSRALDEFPDGLLKHILVTDISRDGALTGPNVSLMHSIRALRPDLQLQASGGVSALADLAALREADAGAAIVGRALYERRFSLEDALAL
jgi:phosphoribosylformimino-5-aminoimidazole carboxamide ribotide isomerase